MHLTAFAIIIAAALLPSPVTEPSLAVVNATVSTSEDGAAVSSEYHFLPGDFVYFTFEIAGFGIRSEREGEVRKISLNYEITAQDAAGRPLAEPASGEIQTELSAEDKNWVPKRRASFLLPSFLAAGPCHIHVAVKDAVAKTESSRDIPFSVGGVQLTPAASITIENFRFLRNESDTEPLTVAAYSPGDTVYARFELTGFHIGAQNQHHVAYGVTVLDASGKPFINDPQAADLAAGSFYPAQFVPGNIALRMAKANARGQYTVVLKARDLLTNQASEMKQAFSLE